MSRSRYYPGRVRPRGYKGDWHDTLHNKRERLRSHLELVDGEREFWDTWDQDRDVLDYRTNWVHEVEARFRNHRAHHASARDKSKPIVWSHIYPCGCLLRCRRDLKICKFLGTECRGRHNLPAGYRYHMGSRLAFDVRRSLK